MKSNPEYKTTPPDILKIHHDKDFGLMVTQICSAYRDESITQTVQNAKLKSILERCDFWLAHLEDYTKGEAGDEITALRSDIEEALK